jgi:hypothetical protein
MSHKIITNHKDSWKVYSTITESIVAEYSSELELKQFIAMDIIYHAKKRAIERLMSFPEEYIINDEYICPGTNKDGTDSYVKWVKQIYKECSNKAELYEAIDHKLNEIIGIADKR